MIIRPSASRPLLDSPDRPSRRRPTDSWAPASWVLRLIHCTGLLCLGLFLSLLFLNSSSYAVAATIALSLAGKNTADGSADRALQEGRVDDAAALLNATLAAHPDDAIAHQLLCRVYYAQNMADLAIHQCELAVAQDPANSDHQMWLGRADGMKAQRTGTLEAFMLARRVRAAFERAVQLNPSNVAAMSDLGEYYVAAPYFLGGGLDRARALAARMMPLSPPAAHRLLALVAQETNDPAAAEAEFRNAITAANAAAVADAWINLARFYQQQDRPNDALLALHSAIAADRAGGRSPDAVLVDAASILTDVHREPDLAERLLRDYLASPAKSDAAPAFKVHLQLSRLLARRGDTASAHEEVSAAAALAAAFARRAPAAQGS
jgi:tetratricopeptide (TPR) repeat protein